MCLFPRPARPYRVPQKRLEALRKDMPSDVDVSIDPAVSHTFISCLA